MAPIGRGDTVTPPGGGHFRQYVSIRLEHVARVARDAADTIYRRECKLDIRQLRVLRVLEAEPDLTVSEIVDATMFERTLVSRIIQGLVKQKLVERRICDVDARQLRLSLTQTGEEKVATADKLGDELNDDLLAVLTVEERASLNRCLEKLMTWRPPNTAVASAAKAGPSADQDERPSR